LNKSKTLAFHGNWDSTFQNQNGTTQLIHAPDVNQGSLTLRELTIRP